MERKEAARVGLRGGAEGLPRGSENNFAIPVKADQLPIPGPVCKASEHLWLLLLPAYLLQACGT
jgi:hypothetical protein